MVPLPTKIVQHKKLSVSLTSLVISFTRLRLVSLSSDQNSTSRARLCCSCLWSCCSWASITWVSLSWSSTSAFSSLVLSSWDLRLFTSSLRNLWSFSRPCRHFQ